MTTQTEQVIANLNQCIEAGMTSYEFYVGKNTGFNNSVIKSLANRGYVVTRLAGVGRWAVSKPVHD